MEARDHEGFFYEDVRHLSHWQLLVDGCTIDPLTSRRVDYYSTRIVGKPGGSSGDKPPVSVRRDRFVSEGVHEDVVLENLTADAHDLTLELVYRSDFADIVEAQGGGNGAGRHWQETTARSVTLWNERDGYRRGTVLTFSRSGRVTKARATLRLRLAPRETWSLCVDMAPIVDGDRRPPLLRCGAFHAHAPKLPMSGDDWLNTSPEV